MHKWNDLYNIGNDYPQYITNKYKPPKPKPKPEKEVTDIELTIGDDILKIQLNDLSKQDISKVEISIYEKN